MKKVAKRLVIAAVCLVAAGGVGLTVVSRMNAAKQAMPAMAAPEETAIPVTVQTPQQGNLEVATDFIGRVEPNEVVNVLPKMAGTVARTYFEVGDKVRKGDLLFEFDSSDLATIPAQMAVTEASYNLAKLQAEQSLGSRLDLQLLQTDASYKTAKNSYDSAHKALQDYVDDYEPNVDKLEEAMDDLLDARDSLRRAQNQAESNYNQVKQKVEPQLTEAREKMESVRQQLDGYIDSTIGTTFDPIGDSQYQALRAQYDVLAQRVEDYQKMISDAAQGINSAQSAIAQNESLYEQTKVQYNNAKDGYDTQLSSLRTAVKNASLGLESTEGTKEITEGKAVDEAKDTVDATLKQAQAQYEATMAGYEQQLGNTRVTSPIDGVIELKNVSENSTASQQNPAYVISNKDIMVVRFNVSASAVAAMAVGDTVRVENGSNLYDGQIIEIGTMVDSQSGLFPIKARVDAPAGTLLTGMSVKVSASTAKAEEALLIPVDSVYHEDEEAYVYVLSPQGTAVRTVIETGITNDETVEVLSGLDASSKVITSWNPNLLDGAMVAEAGAPPEASPEVSSDEKAPAPSEGNASEPPSSEGGQGAEADGGSSAGEE